MGAERGINFTVTYTDLKNAKLLDRASHRLGKFVFVQANGAIDQYAAVRIDDDGQATMLTYAVGGSGAKPSMVGVAQVAAADNAYLWVWVGEGGGLGSGIRVKVAASCAAEVKLYTTATAGVLDDASASQSIIAGLSIVVADGGLGSAIECFAPVCLFIN